MPKTTLFILPTRRIADCTVLDITMRIRYTVKALSRHATD